MAEEVPKVSVLMATKDMPTAYVLQAVNSIAGQTLPPHELIALLPQNDQNVGLFAHYQTIMGKDTLRIVATEKDVYKAWRLGMTKATGDYIAIFDSDDFALPNHTLHLTQLAFHGLKPDIEMRDAIQQGAVVAYSQFFYADERLNVTNLAKLEPATLELLRRKCIIPCPCLVLRSAIEAVGWLDTSYGDGCMYDLWLKLIEKYGEARFKFSKCPTWLYRQRPANRSQHEAMEAAEIENRKRAIQESYRRTNEPCCDLSGFGKKALEPPKF